MVMPRSSCLLVSKCCSGYRVCLLSVGQLCAGCNWTHFYLTFYLPGVTDLPHCVLVTFHCNVLTVTFPIWLPVQFKLQAPCRSWTPFHIFMCPHMNSTDSDWFLHIIRPPHHYARIQVDENFELLSVHITNFWYTGLEALWCQNMILPPSGKLWVLHFINIKFRKFPSLTISYTGNCSQRVFET